MFHDTDVPVEQLRALKGPINQDVGGLLHGQGQPLIIDDHELRRIFFDAEAVELGGQRQFFHVLPLVEHAPFGLARLTIHFHALHVGRTEGGRREYDKEARVADKRRDGPLVEASQLPKCDLAHDGRHPNVDENERPEVEHLGQSERIGCRFPFRHLPREAHDDRE